MQPNIISLFSGAGGLDLGFQRAGFNIIWANEFDKTIWETHEFNFKDCPLDKRSITQIPSEDIPNSIGIIGGPPCQSWSEAGSGRGINDARGQLFHEYIRVLKDKKPLFFLAENVSGILHVKHKEAFQNILLELENSGYQVSYKLLNAHDYETPQDRLRVIIVGFHNSLNKKFIFPNVIDSKKYLQNAISDLKNSAIPAIEKNKANPNMEIKNHEYMTGDFSSMFMSRNRVRSWDEPSFTIQASGRHAPIHPQAPKMQKIEANKFIFIQEKEDLYRRLSVRECARIQTFPDDFVFKYNSINDGYKMVGNAVPVMMSYHIAQAIYNQIFTKDHIDER